MTEFIMLIGLAGSGKSHFAKTLQDMFVATVLESDNYRKNLYGDASTQGNNAELFDAIARDTVALLQEGKNVILDATNLSRKNRVSFLQKINKVKGVNKIAYLVATPFQACVEQNAKRERSVPVNVISRMRENFNVPIRSEGWDNIYLHYVDTYSSLSSIFGDGYSVGEFKERVKEFNQENPHHSHTLGQHCQKVVENMMERTDDEMVLLASYLHDNGKEYTKVFQNAKGEASSQAHFYHHENVGAYEFLFYGRNALETKDEILKGATIIEFHMRPYQCETEKSKEKLLAQVGEEINKYIWMLNEADKSQH